MISFDIPAFGTFTIKSVVFDFNGTLAVDGKLLPGVRQQLINLAEQVTIHVLTADTFGLAKTQLKGIPCHLHILKGKDEDLQKENYIHQLGSETVGAFGNGNNDKKMLSAARLAIAVIEGEGCAASALQSADVIVKSINDGIALLLKPLRCKATLRS